MFHFAEVGFLMGLVCQGVPRMRVLESGLAWDKSVLDIFNAVGGIDS